MSEIKPCPFCGTSMVVVTKDMFAHPGTLGDHRCLLAGKGYHWERIDWWNTRAGEPAVASTPDELDAEFDALYGCQFADCAVDVSYPAHMLKMLNGAPVCEDCVDDMGKVDWLDLEKFVPPEQAKITDLQAKLNKAVEALKEAASYLSALNSIQPLPSTKMMIADLNKALAKPERDE